MHRIGLTSSRVGGVLLASAWMIAAACTDFTAADRFSGVENMLAGYATFQQPVGEWTVMPGIRVERDSRRISSPRPRDKLTPCGGASDEHMGCKEMARDRAEQDGAGSSFRMV